jgi:Holliday junction resolvase-like predicted endonuclease
MRQLKPREQGDIGELSAMEWLAGKGAHIYVPVGHSPNIDLIAEIDAVLLRVEVKTTIHEKPRRRWAAQIATRGGNQSWSGVAKYFDRERCDYLFIHVGDGRRWFIPTGAVDCKSHLTLGGHKYAEFEVEPGRPLERRAAVPGLESSGSPGEYRSGQTGCAVNAVALSFGGSNPPSPISSAHRVKPTNYERKAGQRGEAVINQKRRVTIPQRPFLEAGFENGGRVRLRALGPGRILLEQIELPYWSREPARAKRPAPD